MAYIFYCFLLLILVFLIFKIYTYIKWGRFEIKKSLKGKVILITGGTAGIGKETVEILAKNGATVHVLARNLGKARLVIDRIKQISRNVDIHIHHVDLCDFSNIRSFVEKFLNTQSPAHILINNAGLISGSKEYTIDGNEMTTQANHLGHFLLTGLLLDRIIESSPSRIINVSSSVHKLFNNNFDPYDINYNKSTNKWGLFKAYSRSKLMNVLFTRELSRRLYMKGVIVNAVHPGAVRTELGRDLGFAGIVLRLLGCIFHKTAMQGAQTILYTAISEQVENISGQYFVDCKLARMSLTAVDDQMGEDLWKESERLTAFRLDHVTGPCK